MSPWALSIRRPVFATVVSLALVLFGVIGFNRLSVRELPDIEFPTVTIQTVLPGASPEVVEKEVTEELEAAVSTVSGIRTLTSDSGEEVSKVSIEFELDRPIDAAVQDVRDRVRSVIRYLPEEAEEPVIRKVDMDAQAILWISLNADYESLRNLTSYAENVLQERLQRLPGVGSIYIGGSKRLAIRVDLDADLLAAHGLTVADVTSALRSENVEIPSGRIEGATREFVVQTEGSLTSVAAFNDLILRSSADGPIRLGEVGRASAGDEGERSLARFNLNPHVSIGIVKQSNANTVTVAQAARAEVEAMQPFLPEGYRLQVTYDGATFIEESIGEVQGALVVAGLLVLVVIFLFLHSPRSAIIPALTIPTSVLATFGVIYFAGFTLNSLTLLALTLAIGVVVDDAIIVLENVYRLMESGVSRREAALRGTSEIAFAAIASTLTLVAVFVPVAFITGVIGRFFFEFGVTVVVAVVVSSLVALTLTPMLCSRFLVVRPASGILAALDARLHRLSQAYARALRWSLGHRGRVAGASGFLMVAAVGLYFALGQEFVPPEDRSGFMVMLETPEGSALDHHDRLQYPIERILAEMPEMRASTAFIGAGGVGSVNRGMIFARMHAPSERKRSQDEILREFRQAAAEIPGIRVFATPFSGLSTGRRGQALQFVVQSESWEDLTRESELLVAEMARIPGLVGVRSDLETENPQIRVRIDREKAAALGVSAAEIADTLRILLGGARTTRFRQGNERYEVIVRLDAAQRAVPTQLQEIHVRAANGALIQLASVTEIQEGVGPSSIGHFNRSRSVILSANLDGIPLGEAIEAVQDLAGRMLPAGFATTVTGQSQEMDDAFGSLRFTFLLALMAVFLVLAAQFESFVHPFTILLSLPLAIFGAFLLLASLNMTLNIYSFIGIVMLIGLVTKNSILLVDCTNNLRASGLARPEAVIQAGTVRMRPILMTAISTVVGILPVAAGLGAGAESRRPLGVVVAGGIAASTLLTLIVVPVFYTLLDDARVWLTQRWKHEQGS
ncbi:MAG: efflux RND transporter permease subunit [Candidatus Binatia bacterium]|nr:efflux RND transporter permease subunit [Candidatus Binatia bacterium]